MNLVYKFQELLIALSKHPLSLAFTVGFLTAWTASAILSHGVFDPGLGIENLIINGLSILLLFAANSQRVENHEALHERLDQLHEHITNSTSNEP